MRHRWRERLLRGTLVGFGLVSLFAVYPLMRRWPAGWRWQPHNPAYEHMIIAVYAVLGIFLLRAVPRPQDHRSFILFAGWSSLAHGAVMALDAARTIGERTHLWTDVPPLLLGGLLLLLLPPSNGPRRPVVGNRG